MSKKKNEGTANGEAFSLRTVREEIELDEAEINANARKAAEHGEEIERLKEIRKETNGEIKHHTSERDRLLAEVSTGRGEREIECRVTIGGGTTRGVCPKTERVIFERASTPEEMQMELSESFGEVN